MDDKSGTHYGVANNLIMPNTAASETPPTDGSLTLPPEVAKKLLYALKWRGWAEVGMPGSFVKAMGDFHKSLVEHTGIDVEEFT